MRFELTTESYRLSARGVAVRVDPGGSAGATLADAARAALRRATDLGVRRPVVVGALPFDPEGTAHLYVPVRVDWSAPAGLEAKRDHVGGQTPSVSADFDSGHYRAAVREALRRIASGPLEKVVLAREVLAHSPQPFDVDKVYDRLVAGDPHAYAYRLDLPDEHFGGGALLGASPELLIGCRGRHLRSLPLAGSSRRSACPDADQAAALRLLRSTKDRAEHRYVTAAIREALHEHATDVSISDEPDLVSTPVLWHLGTHVSARLPPGVSILELIHAMHPTPAVCGWPVLTAHNTIRDLEDFDRGLFSGVIGWMDSNGDGDWVLALRGGVIRGRVAAMYAGAGIVAGSDPDLEHTETTAKFQTFASALGLSSDEARERNTRVSPGARTGGSG